MRVLAVGGIALATVIAAVLVPPSSLLSQPPNAKPNLQCVKGPVRRTFGGGPWLVYACDDGKSLVIVSDQGNPASPFYFMIWLRDGTYQVDGEGTGDKGASDAAGDELSHLSPTQIGALLAEAKASNK